MSQPWQSGSLDWSVAPYTKRLQVRSPIRAHAYVLGSIPSWGCMYGRQLINVSLSHRCFSFSFYVCLSLSFSLSKINKHILGRGFKKKDKIPHSDHVKKI